MGKEEALAKIQAASDRLQEETEEIQKQIKKEKQKQIKDMWVSNEHVLMLVLTYPYVTPKFQSF